MTLLLWIDDIIIAFLRYIVKYHIYKRALPCYNNKKPKGGVTVQTKKYSLTEGSIWKAMLLFAMPVFLSNLFQQLYNAFDAWCVGNYIGDNALAAVSSSGSLIFLLIGFFNGLAMGAGVVIARAYGAKDYDTMSKSVHTAIAFGLVCGAALTVVGVSLTPLILRWMGTPSEVLPRSVEYFRYYFMGALFTVMYNIFVGIFHAVGDSRHPLYYLIISTFVNIVLDILFVAVLGFGVGAAAMAGCGSYSKLEGFAFLPVMCFSQALSTFVGQNLGAGNHTRTKKGAIFGIVCGCAMAEVIGVLSYIFAPRLIGFFTDSAESIALGTQHMRTICLFYCLLAFSHCAAGVLRGAGKAMVPMLTMLIIWCVVRVNYITAAVRIVNKLTTVSSAYPLTWSLSGIVFIIYLLKADWIHNFDKKEQGT